MCVRSMRMVRVMRMVVVREVPVWEVSVWGVPVWEVAMRRVAVTSTLQATTGLRRNRSEQESKKQMKASHCRSHRSARNDRSSQPRECKQSPENARLSPRRSFRTREERTFHNTHPRASTAGRATLTIGGEWREQGEAAVDTVYNTCYSNEKELYHPRLATVTTLSSLSNSCFASTRNS